MKARIDDLLKLIASWLRAVSVPVETIRESFALVVLDGAITKAIESVQPHATRKDIAITASVAGPLPAVLGDEGALTEALVNLIGNAVKYTRPGGRVTVGGAAAGGQVVLTVADTGIGIAPEELSLVFDAFYRARSGPGTESGAGLGLALTRRIVQAHEGTLSVESQVGKGTTFSIHLPVHAAGPDGPAAHATTAASTRDPGDTR
jgi:signal transduction histidine kinase